MQHKWHKEIKAWADGAEIEVKDGKSSWWVTPSPEWVVNNSVEYRIKPQPKEPQYLYVYKHWNSKMIDVTAENQINSDAVKNGQMIYVGKIKLEVDDE